MQAQKEALQSGLVTMHDIEMMVVEDEGSITNLLIVVKQHCNMSAMALFGNVVGPLFANSDLGEGAHNSLSFLHWIIFLEIASFWEADNVASKQVEMVKVHRSQKYTSLHEVST